MNTILQSAVTDAILWFSIHGHEFPETRIIRQQLQEGEQLEHEYSTSDMLIGIGNES